MHTVGQNFIFALRAGKRRNVASNASLSAVYANLHTTAFLDFVRVFCPFKRFLRIVVNTELKRCVKRRKLDFIAYNQPSCIAVVSVFLRDKIVVLEIVNASFVNSKLSGRFSVAIVFVRTSCIKFYAIVGFKSHSKSVSRKTEE